MNRLENPNRVAILLPTFNGERYLSDLVNSILGQSFKDYTLYIRDDGSKDNSVSICKELAAKDERIIIVPFERNYGARYSFLALMEIVESSYYMFCDQDDVWMPTKIEDTLKKMKEIELASPNKPIVVHTDLRVVDGDLKPIANSLWQYRGYDVDIPHTFPYLCHYNDVTGCTMMINQLAKKACQGLMSLRFPDFMYYDNMVCILSAKAGGMIVPLKQQTVIYRRHGKNETDALKFGESILHQLGSIADYIKEQKKRHSFFAQIDYGSFAKFMYYKIKLYIIRKWRKKHV